ncbi:MAG: GspE/PulE family protein [Candidatus Nealsonbacteria bacterium]|nr:GspE/PulE family protein [Candidatus Nealsonbacteria bacterium]
MLISNEKLEKILLDSGYIQKMDFDMVKALAKEEKQPLDKMLVEKGLIKDQIMGKLIADAAGYPFIGLKRANIEDITPQLLSYIPEAVALSQRAIVIEEEDGVLSVASNDPGNYNFFKLLERKTGKKIKAFYVTDFDLDQALRRYKGDITIEVSRLVEELEKEPKKSEENIVELVDLILDYGYTSLCSDIHIEPLVKMTIVRYRIDGILYKAIEFPKELHTRVVSRIKILARLRTDERAAAQDGRFEHTIRGATIDLRVSVMPTTDGENVVMRLLMQRGRRFELSDLGLLDSDLKKLKTNADKPYGMIVVVGPTGSGKTTTLYAVLQSINRPEVNIMTIEDPVEYNIERVRQIQVNPAKEITFPKGLRSIVRQDPDIIMVGEIRDKETADIAVNSAMTGHLVLSTLHANDAPTAFSRFLEIGAKAYLISSSVNTAIAQRLVRKICKDCKESCFLSEEELAILNEEPNLAGNIREISGKKNLAEVKFFRGKGCKFCNNSGYEGRTTIFEILNVSEEIRDLITNKAPMDTIRKKAIQEGMTTMVYDGITKALMGITTFEEVRRAAKA